MLDLFGIDFGTTNSATVDITPDGRPRHYGDGQGQPYPSIVAIDKTTGRVISRGREAWNNREVLSQTCQVISSPKTYLGTGKTWKIGGRSWTPVDITAEIIKGLKEEIKKRQQGRDALNEALVSIPVGFSPARRKELRNAAHKAGVEVTGFVSEPTAAIFRNLDSVGHHRKIAVFDWGGGTLDISVVELQEGTVNEIASVGLALGGDELDRLIAEWAHEKICDLKGVSIPFHKMPLPSRDQLVVRTEEAKRELAKKDKASIAVTDYGAIGDARIDIDVETLLSLLEPQICRVMDALEEVVNVRARMSFDELGCILMVGGSSKLIGLYERVLEQVECRVIPPTDDSDWHVAHGAALLAKNSGQYILSRNVGLQLSDNTFLPLLKEGDQIDNVKGQLRLGLVEDSQSAILNFYESRSDSPDALNLGDGRKIGSLIVDTYGFVNESILFEYGVDKDMLLWTTAISSHRGISAKESWHYDKLLFRYNLPGG